MSKNKISREIQVLVNQFNAKQFQNVILKGTVLIKKNPNYPLLYNLVGSAYQSIGDFINSQKNFKNGLRIDPNNLALMNNLAMSYKNLLRFDLAEELYTEILKKNDKYVNAYVNLGNLKRDLNIFDEAIRMYEKAFSISKDNPIIYYSLALAHQGIGNFDKAIFFSQKALELDSNFTRADHLISQSTNYNEKSLHYIKLKEKISNYNSKNFEKIDLYFSLAKAEEDIGNIEKAANYLIKGNKLKKELLNYNVSDEIELLNNTRKNFNKLEIIETKSNSNDNIIFILGMPRSGTSLVEQILSSHSQVFGGGELPILSNIVKNYFIKNDISLIDNLNEKIQDPLFISEIKSKYLNFIKNFKFKEKFITDKAPLNFRWIGFIKAIFPNAKIIHCFRDPKNNCLSLFKNLFEGGLNFSYDQKDLIKYYKSYENLINFWKSKYQSTIFDIKYENLVSNNEEEIKKIINFCNLDWEDKCLKFHKNKAPIKTMSTAQARKPIYKSSVSSFEKYKKYLNILENEL